MKRLVLILTIVVQFWGGFIAQTFAQEQEQFRTVQQVSQMRQQGHQVDRPYETEDEIFQMRPQNAGKPLFLSKQFSIHENFSSVMGGSLVCDSNPAGWHNSGLEKPTYLYVVAILNAAPDYKGTKDWQWKTYRPIQKQVVDERCPGASSVFVSFYIRGIDVKADNSRVGDGSGGKLVWSYEPLCLPETRSGRIGGAVRPDV